jgi:predicted permease
MEIFIKEFKNIFALYRELFILLGVIILVWFLVALIIKKFIRKPERWDDLENDIEDKE